MSLDHKVQSGRLLSHEKFSSKILLFGEYTILNGSKALAFPYEGFWGEWSFDKSQSEAQKNSQDHLRRFLYHFIQVHKEELNSFDIEGFKKDLEEGIWFNSSIPQGYGLGSSGAVVAALYKRYHTQLDSLAESQKKLAQLECFFHGASSGIDPLVSYVNGPLFIHHFEDAQVLQGDYSLDKFFLINTHRPRQTGPLVSVFREKMKDSSFKKICHDILCLEVNLAIDAFISQKNSELFHHLWHISKIQWDYFQEMIPEYVREVWLQGLNSGDYVLKLCGAGGGGYVLGYSHQLSVENLVHYFIHLQNKELRLLS